MFVNCIFFHLLNGNLLVNILRKLMEIGILVWLHFIDMHENRFLTTFKKGANFLYGLFAVKSFNSVVASVDGGNLTFITSYTVKEPVVLIAVVLDYLTFYYYKKKNARKVRMGCLRVINMVFTLQNIL